MKKLISVYLLSMLCLLAGCGGDDPPPPEPPPGTPTLTANTTAGSPSPINASDPLWNSVASQTYDLTGGNAPKVSALKAAAISDSITVQAIISNDTLFMRFQWDDATHSVWKDYFEISDTANPIGITWTGEYEDEDHLWVMFDGGEEFGWDVWNWRSLTTGAGKLAEGYVYHNNSLQHDDGDVEVATENIDRLFNVLKWVHVDTCSFGGYVMYLEDAMLTGDTNSYGNGFTQTRGWDENQRMPGWRIDSTLDNNSPYYNSRRASRFDIIAINTYNNMTEEYVVVLACALNTGKSDDIDLSVLSNITLKVGVFNNVLSYDNASFSGGDSKKAYTADINFVLE